jgi:hypothetical protein
MHACGDGGLVHEGDLGSPKHFKRVDRLNDAGADGLTSDPGLVLLAVHPTLLDNAEANVDDVDVVHLESCAAGARSSNEEVEDEGIKPVGGVPISGHALPVCRAILGSCLTVLIDEPEEEVDEDDIGFAEVPLLKGSTHLGQHGLKEDVDKGSVHRYNVCLRLLVSCVHRADRGTTVVINVRGVVGYIGYLQRDEHEGVGVRFCGEESIDIARSCTEEQVHIRGGQRSLYLGTAAEVKKKFNQDCSMGIPWIGSGKGRNPAFISKRVISVIVDMAEGMLARWGRCCHCLGEYF